MRAMLQPRKLIKQGYISPRLKSSE